MSLTKQIYHDEIIKLYGSAEDRFDYECAYSIGEPSTADLFDDFAASFPPIPAEDFINYDLDEAAELDAAVREIRRRCRKPVAYLDALAVAGPIANIRRLLRDLGASDFWRKLETTI